MTPDIGRLSIAEELAQASLPDARLSARLKEVTKTLEQHPDASFPDAFEGQGPLEAFYRLLRNPRVTPEAVLQPHIEATAERCKEAGAVLLIHDTSTMVLSNTSQRDDLYELSGSQYGYLSHVCLGLTADGLACPLGLLAAQGIDLKAVSHLSRRKRRKHPKSPARRWLKGVEMASSRLEDSVWRVHVMDREGDDYEVMDKTLRMGDDFIIRLRHDRKNTVPIDEEGLSKQVQTLCSTTKDSPVRFRRTVESSERKYPSSTPANQRKMHPEREARQAELSVRSQRVQLKRPSRDATGCVPTLEVNLVHILEEAPPEGEEPVEWYLLTSLDVDTDDQLAFVIDSYVSRWVIEEFFKAFKTACHFEHRQLQSIKTARTAEAILMPIAWKILLMRHLNRMPKTTSAKAILSADQLNVLRKLYKKATRKKLPNYLTVKRAVAAIAELGGHTRPSLPIGWLTLYRGYRKILEAEATWHTMRS